MSRIPGNIVAEVDSDLIVCGRTLPITARLHRSPSGDHFSTMQVGDRCVDPQSDELVRILEQYLREIDEDAIIDARIDDLKLARALEREVTRG